MHFWRCHFGSISGKHLLQLCLCLWHKRLTTLSANQSAD